MPRATYDPPPAELVHLGGALKALRKERGLKQAEVAKRAGVHESEISRIERGIHNPGWMLVVRIVIYGLDASLTDLAAAYQRSQEEAT